MCMTDFAISDIVEATATRVPHRPAVIGAGQLITYGELTDRSRRLARYLVDQGLGLHHERSDLRGHEAGQDLLAQYLYNSGAYIEGMVGGFRARLAPFNVNYRYVESELRYLLRDARPAAIQYHACFAPLLARVLPSVPSLRILLQVDDGSGHALLPGAVDYEDAIGSASDHVPTVPDPDDLYVLYTGGTTGMPKGVLWRQGDAAVALLGVWNRRKHRAWGSLDERITAIPALPHRVMPLAPFMHGAAQWAALQSICEGNTVVIPEQVRRFAPDEAWDTAARCGVTGLTIVGDAFGSPLADAIEARPRELPTLRYLFSGGAALSHRNKQRLVNAVPGLQIIETVGSSESGIQATAVDGGHDNQPRARFRAGEGTVVLSHDLSEILGPGHSGLGWLASSGRVPLGYLGDAAKTARTFPVVEGLRMSVPGDRARMLADGVIELLGREATTINTGGEKVFAEEVEAALKLHPDVADAVVCGRPSDRWGAEVIALVQARPGALAAGPSLQEHCAAILAQYKVPKEVVLVDRVQRTASGKPDYAWALRQTTKNLCSGHER